MNPKPQIPIRSGCSEAISKRSPVEPLLRAFVPLCLRAFRYSHSIVLGGLLEMSYVTRFTPGTSLMIRLLIVASTS